MADMTQMEALESEMKQIGTRFSPNINKFTLIAMDSLAFLCAWFLYGINEESRLTWIFEHQYSVQTLIHFLCGGAIIVWFWGSKRHYTYRKPFWDELRDILYLAFIFSLAELALLAIVKQSYSVGFWFITWLATAVLLPVFRQFAKRILCKFGFWGMPSIIIGDASNATEAYQAILSEPSTGFKVVGFVNPVNNVELGTLTELPYISKDEYFERLHDFPKVFIALEKNQSDLRDRWLRDLTRHGVCDISVVPALRGIPLYGTDMSHFFSHEVMMLRVKNNLNRTSSRIVKRAFDIVVSASLLLILSPILAYIAHKVRQDGGLATYGHERVGLNGKTFRCLKFRSMVMNSKEALEELLKSDSQARDEWEREFKLKNDPRITKVGRFLRKSSLDELPQLWNVLWGEMSLVGPRPVIEEELLRYNEDVDYYYMAKPGMSGLWQVSGRNNTDYATRVYLDSWYVKNWSLWYDIVILFKTVGVVIRGDGAY